jgi:hypothetical protein
VNVAEAFLTSYEFWPEAVVPINDFKNSRMIFKVKIKKEKKIMILENLLKIKNVQFSVDNCSEDSYIEYEIRGCNIRFTKEDVIRLIQQCIGENARI